MSGEQIILAEVKQLRKELREERLKRAEQVEAPRWVKRATLLRELTAIFGKATWDQVRYRIDDSNSRCKQGRRHEYNLTAFKKLSF